MRWTILKEAVRAGATPSTPDGFHKLFEEALAAAWPNRPSLAALLGRFKFREAKDPADGLQRAEKAEKWLPFEVGRVFSMAGRGAGKVVETNFALDSVRVDFEAAKGIAIPIGVASKSLVPLAEGHFLFEKLTAPEALRERVVDDPGVALKHLVESFGRALTMTEVKEAVKGLISEDAWTSWWAAARKNPQVVVHGSGKTATVEWSDSADAADASLLARFEKASLKDRLDLFRKNQKRSTELATAMAKALAKEAETLEDRDPALAFEIAVLVEKVPGRLARGRRREARSRAAPGAPPAPHGPRDPRAGPGGRRQGAAGGGAGDPRGLVLQGGGRRARSRRSTGVSPRSTPTRASARSKSSSSRPAPARARSSGSRSVPPRTRPSAPASTRRSSRAFSTRSPGTSWAPPARRCGRCSTARVSWRAGS